VLVGLVLGCRNHRSWFVPALVLLGAFYAGTWLNSPHHSIAGDALVLALAAIPTCASAALGFAVGQHLAARQAQTPSVRRNDQPSMSWGSSRGGLLERSAPVHERPALAASIVTQLVTRPVGRTEAEAFLARMP
jgi:hypothetical protein